MAFSDEIQKLYISYFNRPADPGGLAYWINLGNQNGENTAAIANAFSASPEYKKTFAEENSTAIVNQIYQNLFGRAAEADGLQYWSSRLDNGTFNLGNIVIAIFNGAQNGDSVAVTNKTLAATQFTAHLTTAEQIAAYTTDRAFALASNWLSGALTPDGLTTALSGLGPVIVDIVGGSTPSSGPVVSTIQVSAGGTYNGISGVNDLFKSSIANLDGSTLTGNAADADILTLTTAGTVTINNGTTGGTLSNIKVLNLADGTNTITYDTSAGFANINGGTGDDTFIPNTALLPITINGGSGTDTIVLSASYAASVSGSNTFASNVTNIEQLRLTSVTNQTIDLQALGNYSNVTVGNGPNGLTLLNLTNNGHVTLTSSGTAMTLSNADFAGGVNDTVNLSLNDASTVGVAFASVGIAASGVETVNISVNDNQVTPTGAFNDTLTWLGNSIQTINISGNAGLTLSASSTALTLVDASNITLGGFTWSSSALAGRATVKGSATGTNTVNMNSATAGADYSGGAGNDNVTVNGTVTSSVALGDGNNSLAINGVSIKGTYTGGSTGTDSLAFFSATPDVSLATITGFENLTIVNNASVTLKAEQLSQFTGNINAAGTETFNLSTAGTFTGLNNIEKYNLANGSNNFTATNSTKTVVGGTGSDTFNFTANQIVNSLTSLDGGLDNDVLNIGATTTQTIDLSTKISNIETINVAGSTGTATFTNVNGAGVTLNYTKSTGDNTINLGSGGQTLNLLGSSYSSTTITGGAAVDHIALSTAGGGWDTLIATGANMSNNTQIDVVSNFNASGVDFFKTGVQATSLGSYIIGNADTSNYLSTMASGLSIVLNNTAQAYLITVQTGSAAGTYLFQNTGSNTAQFDSTDFFIQLTGNIGTISTNNMIM